MSSPYGGYSVPPTPPAEPMQPLSPMNVGGMLSQPITSPAAAQMVADGSKRKALSSWDERLQELKSYKDENGNCLVPGRYKENPQLGRWVESQRKQYRQYTEAKESGTPSGCAMNDDRIALLEGLGFVWAVRKARKSESGYNAPSLSWDDRLEQLKSYKKTHGDCLVPYHYESDPSLGRWVANQRTQFRLYEKALAPDDTETEYTFMTAARVAELREVGFDFAPPRAKRTVASPRKKRAQLPPSDGYAPGDAWVDDDYEEDGFAPPSDDEEATSLPPKKRRNTNETPSKKPAPTNSWGKHSDWTKKKAPSEKKPRGDFGNKENKRKVWNQRFEELMAYKQEHGNCNVPGRYKENPTLGRWVETQRKQYHRYNKAKEEGKTESFTFAIGMDEESRIAKLEENGFAWVVRTGAKGDAKETSEEASIPEKSKPPTWNERLEQLKAFKAENGHCLVPNKYEADKKLGIWVANQRTWYRLYMKEKEEGATKGPAAEVYSSLKEQRIIELNELGFDWAPPRPSKAKNATGKKPKAKKPASKTKRASGSKSKKGGSEKSATKTSEASAEAAATKETAMVKEPATDDTSPSAPEASDEVAV